ncbi:collagen alpha-1(I) chain-like [Homarus americanus]|uniref:collagen alpha-1(I) chain-like n=1 Tax=Homarus americanus TaxID=6706 RepID=UPI001C476ADB|nr:collagen alpha-1(I) chain-like [Homarus americanus]
MPPGTLPQGSGTGIFQSAWPPRAGASPRGFSQAVGALRAFAMWRRTQGPCQGGGAPRALPGAAAPRGSLLGALVPPGHLSGGGAPGAREERHPRGPPRCVTFGPPVAVGAPRPCHVTAHPWASCYGVVAHPGALPGAVPTGSLPRARCPGHLRYGGASRARQGGTSPPGPGSPAPVPRRGLAMGGGAPRGFTRCVALRGSPGSVGAPEGTLPWVAAHPGAPLPGGGAPLGLYQCSICAKQLPPHVNPVIVSPEALLFALPGASPLGALPRAVGALRGLAMCGGAPRGPAMGGGDPGALPGAGAPRGSLLGAPVPPGHLSGASPLGALPGLPVPRGALPWVAAHPGFTRCGGVTGSPRAPVPPGHLSGVVAALRACQGERHLAPPRQMSDLPRGPPRGNVAPRSLSRGNVALRGSSIEAMPPRALLRVSGAPRGSLRSSGAPRGSWTLRSPLRGPTRGASYQETYSFRSWCASPLGALPGLSVPRGALPWVAAHPGALPWVVAHPGALPGAVAPRGSLLGAPVPPGHLSGVVAPSGARQGRMSPPGARQGGPPGLSVPEGSSMGGDANPGALAMGGGAPRLYQVRWRLQGALLGAQVPPGHLSGSAVYPQGSSFQKQWGPRQWLDPKDPPRGAPAERTGLFWGTGAPGDPLRCGGTPGLPHEERRPQGPAKGTVIPRPAAKGVSPGAPAGPQEPLRCGGAGPPKEERHPQGPARGPSHQGPARLTSPQGALLLREGRPRALPQSQRCHPQGIFQKQWASKGRRNLMFPRALPEEPLAAKRTIALRRGVALRGLLANGAPEASPWVAAHPAALPWVVAHPGALPGAVYAHRVSPRGTGAPRTPPQVVAPLRPAKEERHPRARQGNVRYPQGPPQGNVGSPGPPRGNVAPRPLLREAMPPGTLPQGQRVSLGHRYIPQDLSGVVAHTPGPAKEERHPRPAKGDRQFPQPAKVTSPQGALLRELMIPQGSPSGSAVPPGDLPEAVGPQGPCSKCAKTTAPRQSSDKVPPVPYYLPYHRCVALRGSPQGQRCPQEIFQEAVAQEAAGPSGAPLRGPAPEEPYQERPI